MKTIKKIAEVFTGGNAIATSIDSNSTNDEVAGAKAVYDKVNEVSLIRATHARQGINISTAWTQVQVPVDTESLLIGNDYTISNGSVIVGSKPKLVEINLSTAMDSLTSGTYNVVLKVRRAGTTIKSSTYAFSGVANVWNPQLYMLAEVQEGDEINVWYTKGATGTFYFATLDLFIKTLSEVATTTASTTTLNTASLMNTGSLVGMGDRAELTSLALDNEQLEKVDKVEEVTPTEELSVVKDKTEGSGDTI